MMRRGFFLLLVLLFPLGLWAQSAAQVIVFTQPESALDQKFIAEQLPELKAWCAQRGIPLIHRADPSEGIPKEVGFTPAIIHRSTSGVQVFQGRYVILEKVTTFLETASLSDSLGESERFDVAVSLMGRCALVGCMKITHPSGGVPNGFIPSQFSLAGKERVTVGLGYTWQDEFNLRSSDRMFYLDVYPHRDGKKLYLSYALFSPFNCHTPIFTSEKPIKGSWDKPGKAFQKVGVAFRSEIKRTMESASLGDGLTPLPRATPLIEWDQIAPLAGGLKMASELGPPITHRTFMYLNDGSKAPALKFAFLPPVQHYSGTISGGSANFKLGEGGSLDGASGSFEAKMGTLTMGDPALDEYVLEILEVAHLPAATIRFEIESDETLHIGGVYPLKANAYLSFLEEETEVPLALTLHGLGENRIAVKAQFPLVITPFGLEGPDGPSPAAETLTVLADFTLTPYHRER